MVLICLSCLCAMRKFHVFYIVQKKIETLGTFDGFCFRGGKNGPSCVRGSLTRDALGGEVGGGGIFLFLFLIGD